MSRSFDGVINEPKVDFIGKDGYYWWFGEVVDNRDPLKVGRVRVRIFGWYTGTSSDFRTTMPDTDLPWAVVLQPTNQSGVAASGESAGQLQQGAMVMGFFLDGEEAQSPIVMGVVRGTKKPSTENGLIEGLTGQKYTNASEANQSVAGTNSPVVETPGPQTSNAAPPGTETKPNPTNPLTNTGLATAATQDIPAANGMESNFEQHMKSMFADLAHRVSHLVPNNGGGFLNTLDGTLTNVDALIGKIENLVMGIFSEALAGLKELFLQQISKALKAIRIFGQTGIPLIITTAIQAIIQLVLQYICGIDSSFLSQALSALGNLSGFVIGIIGQALDSLIAMLNKAYNTLVNSIICAINGAFNTIRSIISAIKTAIQVAKAIADIIKTGKTFFENLEKLDINNITSIASVISMILGLFLTQCDRQAPNEGLNRFTPFRGTTSCDPPGSNPASPGPCGSGSAGAAAAASAAANILQQVVKHADAFRTAVYTSPSGYGQAQLGTPGRQGTITHFPSGAEHRSLKTNDTTYNNYVREMNRQKNNPNSDPRAITPGNARNTVAGDEFVFPHPTSINSDKDFGVYNKGSFVHTVDGDYSLKIVGSLNIEVEGRLALHVKNAPKSKKNDGTASGQAMKATKNSIIFDSDTEVNCRGKFETQGVANSTIAKPGTDVKLITDTLNLNAPSLNINCSNDLKLCAGNAIFVETPCLTRKINFPANPLARVSGIKTFMFGSYDMFQFPASLGPDAVPRFCVKNLGGSIMMTALLNYTLTVTTGAMVMTCAAGATSISATTGPMAIFSGSSMNLTATAIMALQGATIKLN